MNHPKETAPHHARFLGISRMKQISEKQQFLRNILYVPQKWVRIKACCQQFSCIMCSMSNYQLAGKPQRLQDNCVRIVFLTWLIENLWANLFHWSILSDNVGAVLILSCRGARAGAIIPVQEYRLVSRPLVKLRMVAGKAARCSQDELHELAQP